MVARDNVRNVVLDPRNDDDPHVGSTVNADPKPQSTPGPDVSGSSSAEVADGEDEGSDEDEESGSTRPNQSDLKAAWVDYAVEQGADRSEAEASNKSALIEQYG